MSVFGIGTLLTGESGIGKSELALALINRGHSLIADDAPEFFIDSNHHLVGQAPSTLKHLLEIRGLGIFNIPALFGPAAIVERQTLSLVIQLHSISPPPRVTDKPALVSKPILSIPVTHITLPTSLQRRNELLVETLVLYYQLQQSNVMPTLPIAQPMQAAHRVYQS